METIEQLRATINELNAATAANDVTIAELAAQLTAAQHEIGDVRATAERDCLAMRLAMEAEAARMREAIAEQAAQARAEVGRWSALYQTQDALVRALEAHAPEAVKAAMEAFRSAELAVQMEQLRLRLAKASNS